MLAGDIDYQKFIEQEPDYDNINYYHVFNAYKTVSSKVDFHQSGIEKGTRERVRSKVTKFGYHYKFLSSF